MLSLDTDGDGDGVKDADRFKINGRFRTGGHSGVRLTLSVPIPDGEVNLNFRVVASGWIHSYDTSALEWEENNIDIQP